MLFLYFITIVESNSMPNVKLSRHLHALFCAVCNVTPTHNGNYKIWMLRRTAIFLESFKRIIWGSNPKIFKNREARQKSMILIKKCVSETTKPKMKPPGAKPTGQNPPKAKLIFLSLAGTKFHVFDFNIICGFHV